MAELKRVAGYGTIIALTIGSVMGTGLFMGPAIGAGLAGNAQLISWGVLSIISIYIASCFGELVAMFPRAGGVYEFGKQTYGRFFSFLLGWLAWLVGNIGIVVMIVTGVEYLLPGQGLLWTKIFISIIFLILLNLVSLFGIEGSSIMVIIFTIINLAVILALVIPGAFKIDTSNYTPFFTGGLSPILVTMFFIAEGFFGWEAASYLSEETKNPEKIIPRSLVIATTIVSVLVLATVIVCLGLINFRTLASSSAPIVDSARAVFGWLGPEALNRVMDAFRLGVYLTMLGCAAGTVVTMPRLILALARDKLFLKQFSEIHPKYSTPHKAIYFQFIVGILILLIGFGNYTILLSLLVPLGFIMYAFTLLSVPLLRFRKPEIKREFKAPLGKVLPFFVVVLFFALVFLWVLNTEGAVKIFGMGLSLILLGVPLYILIGLYNDPHMITDVNDLLAYLTLLTESINIPKSVVKEIMTHIGALEGKEVLEYGCGVGTLTTKLAKAIGPSGTLYATSFSKNHLSISSKRFNRAKWVSNDRIHARVRFIHDIEHTSRVHPEVGRVDAIVSIGMISYVQDLNRVLNDFNKLLPENGRICFVDYGDFFHVIPNVDWLEKNSEIEKRFRAAGFSVQVKRKKALLWSHIFIYGIKSSQNVGFI